MPVSRTYQREMGFPKEGDVVGGFRVKSVSIEHSVAYTEKLARYEYSTRITVEGDGTVDDVEAAFKKFFEAEKTLRSSYGSPYQCRTGKMSVHPLGGKRFRLESLGTCEKALDEEPKTEASLDLGEVALKAFEAIFGGRESVNIGGQDRFVERTSGSKLRYVRVSKYSFLEQNPNKSSRWAKMANEGHKILWVLEGAEVLGSGRGRRVPRFQEGLKARRFSVFFRFIEKTF